MALHRGIDGAEPVRGEPVARRARSHEERKSAREGRLAVGTLACPACDAPIALHGATPLTPAQRLRCSFCAHGAPVRDFLSLARPTRPTRVEVRVVVPS